MKIKEILPGVFNISTFRKSTLCKIFIRFQEHYESPEFRNKTFTLDEYKEWYIKNSKGGKKTGKFTYYKDWSGFNIPSYVLDAFYDGKFTDLTKYEKKILDYFKQYRGTKFYIIGVNKTNDGIFTHEIAHALYYIDTHYKKNVDTIINNLPTNNYNEYKTILLGMGYCEKMVPDEIQAYLISNHFEKSVYVNSDVCSKLNKYLRVTIMSLRYNTVKHDN